MTSTTLTDPPPPSPTRTAALPSPKPPSLLFFSPLAPLHYPSPPLPCRPVPEQPSTAATAQDLRLTITNPNPSPLASSSPPLPYNPPSAPNLHCGATLPPPNCRRAASQCRHITTTAIPLISYSTPLPTRMPDPKSKEKGKATTGKRKKGESSTSILDILHDDSWREKNFNPQEKADQLLPATDPAKFTNRYCELKVHVRGTLPFPYLITQLGRRAEVPWELADEKPTTVDCKKIIPHIRKFQALGYRPSFLTASAKAATSSAAPSSTIAPATTTIQPADPEIPLQTEPPLQQAYPPKLIQTA
ncbi:uncharacterized protein LOC107620700 [Arachis ipaensis]|uniref:uncharacterized protein LOC107620700 n=1 Tax=Arachis ipaensis TaxID=130454 RepID=UPI0007AFBBD0|nr:uncharacterized protein LOC107620700 [Arachis ipaensis]